MYLKDVVLIGCCEALKFISLCQIHNYSTAQWCHDRIAVDQCNILKYILPDDSKLEDRGFIIKDLLALSGTL